MEPPTIITANLPGIVVIRCLNVDPDANTALPASTWRLNPPIDGRMPIGVRAWGWQSRTDDGDHSQYTYDLTKIFPNIRHGTRCALVHRYGITPPGSTAKTATAAASVGTTPLIPWYNTAFATYCNNQGASVDWSTGLVTQQLQCTDYPFPPLTPPILGIQLRIRRWAYASQVHDTNVQMMKAGTPVGDNKAAAGNWSQTGFENKDYGGPTDTWGTTWDAADPTDPGFGATLTATSVTPSGGAFIDCMTITIWTPGHKYQFTTPTVTLFEFT